MIVKKAAENGGPEPGFPAPFPPERRGRQKHGQHYACELRHLL
jgi:hypothetical protein